MKAEAIKQKLIKVRRIHAEFTLVWQNLSERTKQDLPDVAPCLDIPAELTRMQEEIEELIEAHQKAVEAEKYPVITTLENVNTEITIDIPKRSWYLPKKEEIQGEIRRDDLKAVVYLYSSRGIGKPAAAMFGGKRSKPDNQYYYRDETRRAEAIQQYFEGLEGDARRKEERKQKRQVPNTLKVGDILDGSWGYDQTNVEFFQVVEVKGQYVMVRELCQITDKNKSSGGMSDYRLPVPDAFTANSKPIRKKVQYGNTVTFRCFNLSPWGGDSRYSSSYH
jgi:hypothetical protein